VWPKHVAGLLCIKCLYAFVGFITTPNVLLSVWKSCVGYHAHPYVARQGVILVTVAGLANCCGDSAGLTLRGSNPSRRMEFFSFAYDPDQLCGPHSCLSNGKFALFPAGVERPGLGADWHEWICIAPPSMPSLACSWTLLHLPSLTSA